MHAQPPEETIGTCHDELAYGDADGDQAVVVFRSVERQFLFLCILEQFCCVGIFLAVCFLALFVFDVKVQQYLEELGREWFVEGADDGGLLPYKRKALPHVDRIA